MLGGSLESGWNKGLSLADMRRTWAGWHVHAITPLNALQELGGWSDYKIFTICTFLAPEHLAHHAADIGAFYGTPKNEKSINSG
ncbi:hypothetical protein NP603_07690 [Methylomonas sp. SURF-1]|uniref:Uncharacterized protein n=1 Tax=Methylomonas aurea TaxID=2952224 RepID=A0ABT1UFN5_9GAMM|nr:hypothetical protein [Methylomonas sp. SURF-1]MCQ8180985.1 hypothetical protein [Methylomonas sp. SURF-1]